MFAEFRHPALSRRLVTRLRTVGQRLGERRVRFMEVCGTHTMSVFRNGIQSLLPPQISLVSGPGCPVCVTDQAEIDAFIALAGMPEVVIATFGDLMRVPGTGTSLVEERRKGADIRVVYSPLDALAIARAVPHRQVVFLGVGFETTAPTVAAAVQAARREAVANFSVFSAHKRVLPALHALMGMADVAIDGFLLPGHVSAVIGADAYRPFVAHCGVPAVVAGFEPVDLLSALVMLGDQAAAGHCRLENAYDRVVTGAGNGRALALLKDTFDTTDAHWRGLGKITGSGLALKRDLDMHDARRLFPMAVHPSSGPGRCRCGEVLTGRIVPTACALFGGVCTPAHPMGPCMVSSEGTCAAYHHYGEDITSNAG